MYVQVSECLGKRGRGEGEGGREGGGGREHLTSLAISARVQRLI